MKTKLLIFSLGALLIVFTPIPDRSQAALQGESPELTEAAALHKSALKLYTENKGADAIPLAEKALAIRQRLLPANDVRVEESLEMLGIVYYAKADYRGAKSTLERALKLRESRLGPDSFELEPILDRLGLAYYFNHDLDKAESALVRVVALKEKEFGPEHYYLAVSLSNLANYYRSQGEWIQAAPLYKHALELIAKKSGVDSAEFTQVSNNFICMCYENSQSAGLIKEFELLKQRFTPHGEDATSTTEVLNGRALSLPAPRYPLQATAARQSGRIIVKVWIDEDGNVYQAGSMCGGDPALKTAAVNAAKQAKFSPTLVNGVAVKITGVVVYNFVAR